MDKQKYLDPKFSLSLQPLMKYLQKKHGTGSSMTNISKFSQSQHGGGPASSLLISQGAAVIGNPFNDSYSLSSVISQGATDKRGCDSNTLSSLLLGNQNDSKEKMFVEDQRDCQSQQQRIRHQESCSVIEQSIEEEEETAEKVKRKGRENIQISRIQPGQIGEARSPFVIEPVLKAKNTSRTTQGLNYKLLNGSAMYQNQNTNNESCISDQSASIYGYQSTQQQNTRRTVTDKQRDYLPWNQQRKPRNMHNSIYSGQNNKQPSVFTTLESAYKTSYSQTNHQAPSNPPHSHSQLKKGQKLLNSQIESNTSKNKPKKQEIFAQSEQLSPDVFNSYYNNYQNNSEKQRALSSNVSEIRYQSDNSRKSQVTIDRQQVDKYSAISIKRSSENNQTQQQFLEARNKLQITKKEKTPLRRKITKQSKNLLSVLDNVYNAGFSTNQQHQDKLTKISLQVFNRAYNDTDPRSSLQKNYVQNLNELVKIHQEMKQQTFK